jgi:predicted nuclease with TOPRIM domain
MELKFKQTAEQIENTLKLNQRQKSDLQTMNMKLVNKIEVLTKKVDELNESIESICTIILCLMESQCMQIRA